MGTFFYFTAITLFILLSVILCFIILIQESKNAGLGAAFGGSASDSMFGTSTADVLKTITSWLALAFLVSCVVLSMWTTSMGRSRQVESQFPVETIES